MEILREGNVRRVLDDQQWFKDLQCRFCRAFLKVSADHLYFLVPPSTTGYVFPAISYDCPSCGTENPVELEPDEIVPIRISWNKQLWLEKSKHCCQCEARVAQIVASGSSAGDNRIYSCRNCCAVFQAGPADVKTTVETVDHDQKVTVSFLPCPCCQQPAKYF